MERIKLSKNEKKVLRLINTGSDCPSGFSIAIYSSCVRSLERHGLAKGAYIEGGDCEAARLTPDGRCYLAENPKLRNPIDWKWIIATIIAIVGVITTIIIGFVACNKLN